MSSSDGSSGISGQLSQQTSAIQSLFNRIASGVRFAQASDDSASQAISDQLSATSIELGQASQNTSDANSISNIQDSVYSSLSDISTRQDELAIQSANGTYSDSQRALMNQEFQSLSQEATQIVSTASYNGQNVFQGSISVQVGTDSSSNSQITISRGAIAQTVSDLGSIDISSQSSALSAIQSLSTYAQNISDSQGLLGAQQSVLNNANNVIQSQNLAVQSANSQIKDTDIGSEISNLISTKISQYASVLLAGQNSSQSSDIIQKLFA